MTAANIQIRRGTTVEWAARATALAAGEFGWDRTTGEVKVGDGSTLFASLPVAFDIGDDATDTELAAAVAALDSRLDAIEGLGPLATDVELAAEAVIRAAADTALDGRLDVIEAISIATDAELASAVSAHTGDAVDAHAATAISYAGSSGISATTVEAALDELDAEKIATTARGAANGVASLDAGTKIPAAQVPDQFPRRVGGRTVFTGDSVTAGAFDGAANRWGDGWTIHLVLSSGGRIRPVWNAAHGGYTSTQLLALFASEVLAYDPNLVVIMAGTNDVLDGSNKPTATIAAITAMVNAARAYGADVALCTIPPQGTAALPTPAAPTLATSPTGGTLAAGTWGYKISAANAYGETVPSPAATVTTTGTTSSVLVSWPLLEGAVTAKVYRETAAGSGTYGLVGTATNLGLGQSWFTDTGTASGAAPAGANGTANAVNATAHRKIATINAWIRHYATENAVSLVDMHSVLVDPTTGMYKTGLTGDGTHPTSRAGRIMGTAAWVALSDQIAGSLVPLTQSNVDPVNLQPNGCLVTGSATTPSGWGVYGGSASGFVTTLAPKAGFLGKAYTVTRTIPDVRYNDGPAAGPPAGTAIGDRILVAFVVQTDGFETSGGGVGITFKNATGGLQKLRVDWAQADTEPGVWTWEFIADANFVANGLYISVNHNGIGSTSVGQLTVYNLTALGLV